jgi:N-acetylmuramoyl-L-alanine amidase
MALKVMALIPLRPRRASVIAAAALTLLAVAGCSGHRRTSLRPIYTSPATSTGSAPCTNCGSGSGSATIINGSPLPAGAGAPSRTLSSEPTIDETAGDTDSTVPSLGSPAGSSRSSQRNALPEPAPKASIGSEPDLDMIPSQSVKPRSSTGPSSPSSKGPALNGPGSTTSSLGGADGVRAASATGRVRQVSMQERLRPFLDESEGNELFYPSKADRPWQYIVLHHSANASGNYDQIDGEHRKVLGYDGCGYHFVIGNGTGSADGQIEVAQRWVKQKHGVHCRNAKSAEIDEYGIGICFIGDLDKEPPTPRQVAAAKALITYLGSRYSISRSRVETHAHLAATPTVCPGRYFPTQSVIARALPDAENTATARSAVPASWRVARGAGPATY